VFNDIPHITPDGVFMTKLTRIGRQFIFEGKSQSNALISVLMSAIETSDWMQTPHLEIIQNQDKPIYDRTVGGEPLNDFVLHTQQTDLPTINIIK
jgi:type IV pilus assembly protein PilN